ncbi:uncharacterized protein LOC128723933 [Anopheles nili]|uniref:uncharacterized protein LOC128723933 n=1 Tax=Anopheles nili TaxID=185578 RepID=UPI00237B27B0|nr:uncharacterized protein LOC128723933 [Anopheles nili]
MKLTLILVITVATVASLCSASPLLVTKHVVKKLVAKHHPKTTKTVVYTPVVAKHAHSHAHKHLLAAPMALLPAKLATSLGALLKFPLLKHPFLNHPLLARHTPGGVVEVVHKHNPDAPYAAAAPAVTVVDLPPKVVELPPKVVEEHHTLPVPVPTYGVPASTVSVSQLPVPAYGVPVPSYVPAPTYGVPAATYGVPVTTGEASSSSSSSSASSSASASSEADTGAKYVAVNLGARHEAPLPGHEHSVVLENLEPAPGTETLTMLLPPVVSNELSTDWHTEPVVLRGQDLVSSDMLRMATEDEMVPETNNGEARYIAVNNGVRHEAPLPGYDHSIVIENLDTV